MPEPASDTEQAPSDPYLERLLPSDRDAYRAARGHLDLTEEIRLMRTVLSHLADDIPANHRAMSTILGALVRAVHIQARSQGGAGEAERALLDAADAVLDGAEGEL